MTCGLESFNRDKKNKKNANTPSSNVIIGMELIPTRQDNG